MDWRDLRYVLALGRTGSLVAAGRALGVEHTTVGRRIAAIEKDLGVRLFLRAPDGHVPTPAGEHAITTAAGIERAVIELEAAVVGGDTRPVGSVRLTTAEGFLPILMPHLRRLYEEHPGLSLELLSGSRVFDLTRGEADIALRFLPTTHPELIARRVSDVGWALYASEAYLARHGSPGDPPALRGHHVVDFDGPLTAAPGGAWLAENAGGAEVVMRGNTTPTVVAAVAAGLGLACLPCLVGDPEPRVTRISGIVATGQAWLIAHPDRQRGARVRVVWEFLLDVLAREGALLTGRSDGQGR